MAITYEEALETLTSMFGDPWNRETLDTVLRHYKGHMENTVEAVLQHGDGDPQALIDKLQQGDQDDTTAMDEQLALQLAREERGSRSRAGARTTTTTTTTTGRPDPPAASAAEPPKKGRGTFTELPSDFLRIPGSTMDSDAALARMLQDELFSQELANNPEFAHLARGRPRTVGGRPTSVRASSGRAAGRVGEMPRRTASQRSAHEEGPNIMDRLSEMGDHAKRRLQVLAAQFDAARRAGAGPGARTTSAAAAQPEGGQEMRGLLDGDGDEQEMEMTSGGGKKNM